MDTLKQYDRLRASGVPEEQARAQVEAMADTLKDADLATKGDLANLESRMTERMDSRISVLRADIRSDMHKIVAALAVGFAIVIARMFFGG